MIVNIVAGSKDLKLNIIKDYQADLTIGVDYGAYNLISNNFNIDIAVGDFDSITSEQYNIIVKNCKEIYKYDSEKAKSDTEIALLKAIELKATDIYLFGVTGKRLDHFLGVINLFNYLLDYNFNLYIVDEYNKIYLLKPGEHSINKNNFKYLSFFSFNGDVPNLTIKNFKYELYNHYLSNKDSLCISNEIVKDFGIIKFDKGLLLIVESND